MEAKYVNECNEEIPDYIFSKAKELGCIDHSCIYKEGEYGGKLPKASIGCSRATCFRNASNAESMKVPLGDGWVAFKSPSGKGSNSSSEAKAEKHTSILCLIEDIFKNLDHEYKTYLTVHGGANYKNAEKKTNRTFYHLKMYTTDPPKSGSNVKDPDIIVVERDVIQYVIEVKWGYLEDYPTEPTDLKSIFDPKELNEIISMIRKSKVCRVTGPHIQNGNTVNENENPIDFKVCSNTKFLVVSDLRGLHASNPADFNSIKNQYKNYDNLFSICDIKEDVDTFYSLDAFLNENKNKSVIISSNLPKKSEQVFKDGDNGKATKLAEELKNPVNKREWFCLLEVIAYGVKQEYSRILRLFTYFEIIWFICWGLIWGSMAVNEVVAGEESIGLMIVVWFVAMGIICGPVYMIQFLWVEKIKDIFEKQQRIEKQKITPDLFDAAQRRVNEAAKLFEGKEYEKSLEKYQESLSKFIDARNGAAGLKDEGLVKAIGKDIYNVKKSIIACGNAIGISFSEKAKKSFDSGNYGDAIAAYRDAITKFEDAVKDTKEIEDSESVERIEDLIKGAEENIENCHVAIDKGEVENLFKESKSLHEKAAELAKGGEMFNAKGVLRDAEAKINSAFEISTKRKFSDAVNKLNLLLKTIRGEMNVIDEKISSGIHSVDFSEDIFKIKEVGVPDVEIPTEKEEIALTIERAIYDPCKRDFIEGRLPRMKEWINRYDKGAYWFAISIQNNTDKEINDWDVEIKTSSALKIKEAKIEGIEIEIPHEAHLKSFKISVPKEYGIVIPKGGAQRVYFKLRAEKPKTTYEISGVFKSEITGDVPIRAKEFKYLCDTGVPPEAVKAELKKTFSEKDAARLALSFKTVQELDRMCDKEAKTEEYLDKLSSLKGYTEGFSDTFSTQLDEFSRFMKQEQLEYLDDAYKEKVRRFCTNLVDVWISEFLKG